MRPLRVFVRGERKTLLAWGLGLGAYILLIGATFGLIAENPELTGAYDDLPEGFKEAFGGLDDLSSPDGYLDSQVGAFMPFVLGILAVRFASRHLAGAEESGRIDHVLARPITRRAYYWSLVGAGGLLLAGVLVLAALAGVLGFALGGAGPRALAGVAARFLEYLPLALVYLGLGTALGALFHRPGPAHGVGLGVVALFYVMDVVARLLDGLSWLAYLTPNGYLSRSDLYHGSLDPLYLVFSLTVAAALAFLGVHRFERKDLYA